MSSPPPIVVQRRFCVLVVAALALLLLMHVVSASDVTFSSENRSVPWMPRNLAGCLVTPDPASIRFLGGITTGSTPSSSQVVNDTWSSVDSGVTWTQLQPLNNATERFPVLPNSFFGYEYRLAALQNSNLLFFGGLDNRPRVSSDGGFNWRYSFDNSSLYPIGGQGRIVTSFPHSNVVVITGGAFVSISPTEPRYNDIWASFDGEGAVWQNMTSTVVPPFPKNIAGASMTATYPVNGGNGALVVAGGCDNAFCHSAYNSVWVSYDYGTTWPVAVNASWSPRAGHLVTVDTDNVLYLYSGNGLGDLWQSTDVAVTWTLLTASSGYAMSGGCFAVQQFTNSGGKAAKQLVLFTGQNSAPSPIQLFGLVTACLTDDCTRSNGDSASRGVSAAVWIAAVVVGLVVIAAVVVILLRVIRNRRKQDAATVDDANAVLYEKM